MPNDAGGYDLSDPQPEFRSAFPARSKYSMQYSRTPNVKLHAEIGQPLSGGLGGWAHYLGVGSTVLI